MTLRSKLFRSIAANNLGVIGQIVIAFFLAPYLVHSLGDTTYGLWTVVMSLTGYFSLLDLGVSSALTRYISKYSALNNYKEINAILNSALLIFIVVSVFIIAISPVIASILVHWIDVSDSMKNTIQLLTVIVSFDMAVFVMAGLFRGVLAGYHRFDIINIARLSSLLFKAICFYLLLESGFGIIEMGIISVLANVGIIVFYYYLVRKRYSILTFSTSYINRQSIGKVVGYSKYIFIAMISNQVFFYSSSFIISAYISLSAVTLYAIPWSLAEYVKQFCLSFSRSYIPVFSELSENNEAELNKYYLQGSKYILIISNLFCVGFIVLGDAFIALWMGERYAIAAQPLVIILFVSFYLYAPQLISYALLQGMSKHKNYAYLSVLIAAIGLTLSIMLVEDYGLNGVALGTAIPWFIIYGLVVPISVSRLLNSSYYEYLKKTHFIMLLPTLLLAMLLVAFKYYIYPTKYSMLLIEAAIAAIFYFTAIYLIVLDTTEKEWVIKLMKSRMVR